MGEPYEDIVPVQPVPISVRQASRLLAPSPLSVSLGVGAEPAALQVCDRRLAAAAVAVAAAAVAVARRSLSMELCVCLWALTKALSMVLNTVELLKATE